MDSPGIYKIINKINGKFYVGSSQCVRKRWNSHKSDLRRGKHNNQHLQNAWNKYGEDAFVFEFIEEIPIESLIKVEQIYIEKTGCYDPAVGYNLSPTAGSSRGIKHSQEVREACSNRMKERYSDPEWRLKTSEATKLGYTEEVKAHIIKQLYKRWSCEDARYEQSERMKIIANDPIKAKKRDDKIKKRWSDPSERERHIKTSPHRKRIIHVETGDIYESVCDAERKLPISKQTIKNNLRGKFKSAKGYNFRILEEDEDA